MTKTIAADLCVIGAGSGGLSVAAGAAQLGRKVVLIEKGEMGGDCLNAGCVPSKALIAAAASAHAMRTADRYGLGAVEPDIDFAAVMDHVRGVIDAIAPHDSQERFEGLGVTVLRDHASFAGERRVRAGDHEVNAKHIVIATGSAPLVPPIPGLNETNFLTNETIFENRARPDHLIVVGGGPVGVEMAQAHRRLGANVTIIEADTLLGKDDPELVEIVRAQLQSEDMEIIEGVKVDAVRAEGGEIHISAGAKTVAGSHLLVAAGRKPTLEGLNLETAGVDYDARGVKVDKRLRTTNKRVYAIGDAVGGRQFTHVAGYHASIVIRNILFKMPAANRDDLAPWVTYADPELAHVGLTEARARERHGDVKVARWPFDENDRAQTERDTRGLVKAVTDKSGRILGASIVGRGAGDLIQPWVYALAKGDKIKSFTDYITPYPTRGEASKRAAGAWYAPALFSRRTKTLVSLLSIFD